MMRLLPEDPELGWTPWAWLVYFVPFLAAPFLLASPPSHVAWSLAAAGVFLALYFRGHWARPRELSIIIVLITMIGVATSPINPGAVSLFIFAAGFAGQLGTTRRGVIAVAFIVLVVALQALIIDLRVWMWAPAIVFSIVIGGVNIHYGERARAAMRLRLADHQIEHLAKVAERERIARDLHDLLGHTLSVIVLKSELARRISERDPARAAKEIAQVEQIARDALAEVRTAVTGYRSAGIAEEIRRAASVLRDAGLEVEQTVAPISLPAGVESVLALVVREGATNILRHAGATRATIALTHEGTLATLEIADNGAGGVIERGSGLNGMAERADAVGGNLSIRSEGGTVLRLTVPLRMEESR